MQMARPSRMILLKTSPLILTLFNQILLPMTKMKKSNQRSSTTITILAIILTQEATLTQMIQRKRRSAMLQMMKIAPMVQLISLMSMMMRESMKLMTVD